MEFEFIIRDKVFISQCFNMIQYGNLRGIGYEDAIEMNVTLNHKIESTVEMFDQSEETGHYMHTY